MNGNGQQPPSLVGPDNRPVSPDDPIPYALGDMVLALVGTPTQNFQAAFQRVMPEVTRPVAEPVTVPAGHPSNPGATPQAMASTTVLASMAQLRSSHELLKALMEITWQASAISMAQAFQSINELQFRVEAIERALNTILEGGYTIPTMPSLEDTGVYQSNRGGSAIRVWPHPDGTYPPFTVPDVGMFGLGMHRTEVQAGDIMKRTDDGGLTLTRGDQVTVVPKMELQA